MSVQQPSVSAASPLSRLRWLILAVALALGIAAGVVVSVLRSSSPAAPAPAVLGQGVLSAQGGPAATWRAGQKLAPGFSLSDAQGHPISLDRFRGRPVILTFIDPLCTTFCPIEASVLDRMLARLPAAQRPAIVSVSVNRLGDDAKAYRHDAHAWKLTSAWHWAVGSQPALQRVWRKYAIGVTVNPQTKDVEHTEAAYLVDRNGYQRALYVWPFNAGDLVRGLRAMNA